MKNGITFLPRSVLLFPCHPIFTPSKLGLEAFLALHLSLPQSLRYSAWPLRQSSISGSL